jgi:hypothetical protein
MMGDFADMYDYDYDPSDFSVTCKFCGRSGLYWDEDGAYGWRLVDLRGRQHRCRREDIDRIVAAEFTPVP